MGGPQRTLGQGSTDQPNGFLAIFHRGPEFLDSSITSPGNLRLTTTTGDRTETVLQSSPGLVNPVWTSIATNNTPGFSWTVDVSANADQQFFRAFAR